jgi:hypothetical protein
MIDYNRTDIELLMAEVLSAHQLDASEGLSDAEWQTLEEEYYAYWNSAKDLFKNRLDHYDDVRDEFDEACDQAKAEISPDLSDSEKTDKETEMDRKIFDDHVKILSDIYIKAIIESILMQGKQIAPQDAIYGDDSFSLLVEAALLKATNQLHVIRKITDPMNKKIVESFDQSTPLKKALSYVYHLSNNFYVEPNEEQYFTGERLFCGIKNKKIRKDEDASAEAIFKADLRSFVSHLIHKDSFRQFERNSLEETCMDNDGNFTPSAELQEFNEKCDTDIETIIDQLVPIFKDHIQDGKFVDLVGAAEKIENLGDDAVTLLTESILGYESERNDEHYFQMGTGELMLNQQLYVQVQPYDRDADYDYDKGEAEPSQQVTKYRFDLAVRMRDSCQKIDPGFEENPRFANVMRAFGVIADYVIPKKDREALAEYAQEVAAVRAEHGEDVAMEKMKGDLAKARANR